MATYIILEWRYYYDEARQRLSGKWKNYNSEGVDLGTYNTLGHYISNGYVIEGQSAVTDPNGATIINWTLRQ